MRCKCKILSTRENASDGSHISERVLQEYLNSDECQKALDMHKMLSTLTHRSRNLQAVFPDKPGLAKTVGKDDSMIVVSTEAPAPTHYVDKLYIEDGWLWGEIQVLDETGMDDIAIQNIRRLKGMLRNGIMPGVSAVIVGYWRPDPSTSCDNLEKLVQLKGVDITLNPSWKKATITEAWEEGEEKNFSDTEDYSPEDFKYNGVKVKAFSDLTGIDINVPKSSKINGQFTKLIAKEFSSNGTVSILNEEINESDVLLDQKEYTQAAVKDRLREAKMSPRMFFRRTYINYKQTVRAMGGPEKMSEEDMKILKSMFTYDMLMNLHTIQPEILKGKQINTLLGCSSVSKTARMAAQNLQMPFRMAMVEMEKNGFVSKIRYQKLQEAYLEFIKSLCDDVFGSAANNEPIPEENEEAK